MVPDPCYEASGACFACEKPPIHRGTAGSFASVASTFARNSSFLAISKLRPNISEPTSTHVLAAELGLDPVVRVKAAMLKQLQIASTAVVP